MISRLLVALLLLAASACSDFPRDPDGTLKRVWSEGSFRAGIIAPINPKDAKVDALLRRVSAASGAKPQLEIGDAEPLLDRLEKGEIDLVIGRFEGSTPWARLVSLSPPLRVEKQGKTEIHLVAAMQNGENAWISLVEGEARNVTPKPE